MNPCRRSRLRSIAIRFASIFSVAGLGLCQAIVAESDFRSDEKPILVVVTDIGGDPDDQQSMRRLLLYANEFEIRGLIASATGTPGEVKGATTRPDLIKEIIQDYESVLPNLLLHADGYPSAEYLRNVVASGDPERTVDDIAPGKATSGSQLIVEVVDSANRPVYLALWGGARDLAQALCDVRDQRSEGDLANFVSKLRVYAIGDQDGYNAYRNGELVDVAGTGLWIKQNFPDLRYVETNPPERNRFASLFRGMYQNDSIGGPYETQPLVRPRIEGLNNVAWLEANVRQGHGPLGAGYPITGQNPETKRNTAGVKEGDTPSWFFVLPNGLSDPEHPDWGSWGGRFELNKRNHFIDTKDRHWYPDANEATGFKWTVARWREAQQNDFAARMDWCVKPFGEANHEPRLAVSGDKTKKVLSFSVKADEPAFVEFETSDPDGDFVSVNWWVYSEASGIDPELIHLEAANGSLTIKASGDAGGNVAHLIGEAVDNGSPPLVTYRRLIVSIVKD